MTTRARIFSPVFFGAALAVIGVAETASAFCRTTTVPVAADFQPSPTACWDQGNPLFWKNACVSYDINQAASKQVSYDQASTFISRAFAQWTSTTCSTDGTGTSRVSIDVRDMGPVACDLVTYNTNAPNQHVIVFRDDSWPHNDANNTLALTTVTFDPDTGEIYDADMEVNSHDETLTVTDSTTIPADGYDFLSIVTHETGHFLGMAHSGDSHATMYAHYIPGTTSLRNLTQDDIEGICTVYRPDGTRAVLNGEQTAEDACDPTPRHGFSTQCDDTSGTSSGGCSSSVAGVRSSRDAEGGLAAFGAMAILVGIRRSRRSARRRPG